MKVLHLCLGCFYIDNYSYQENLLPKYHKELGYEVSIIASLLSFDDSGRACLLPKGGSYTNEYGIPVTRIDYANRFKKFSRIFRLFSGTYESLVKERPDIIFIHGCQFWDMHKVVKYLKKNQNVKVYFDNHADFSNSATNWLSRNILHKFIWRHCAKIIEPYTSKIYGVLPARTKFLIDIYKMPDSKVEFLPMGADDEMINWKHQDEIRDKIRSKFKISKDDFLIITGGKIDPAKAQTLLLMKVVRSMPQNVKLIIFGSIVPALEEGIMKLCDGEQVQHIGWINSDDIYNYFLASDLGVFPGRHSVMWEQAIGTGLPCVFKYWEGVTHVDLGGNCRFLYNDTFEEIYDLINEIYSDEKVFKKMKNVSIEKGVTYFSYNEIGKKSIEHK